MLYNTVCVPHANKLKIPLTDAVQKIIDSVSQDDVKVNFEKCYDSSHQSSFIEPSSQSSVASPASDAQKDEKKCACVPILVVDDNEFNVILLQEILYTYKLQSESAHDGKEACEMFSNRMQCCPYQLVFMDINMPIMDGFEATVRIRELCQKMVNEGKAVLNGVELSKLHIVALTANDTEQEREICLESGFSSFLSKPPVKEQFKSILESVFGTPLHINDLKN